MIQSRKAKITLKLCFYLQDLLIEIGSHLLKFNNLQTLRMIPYIILLMSRNSRSNCLLNPLLRYTDGSILSVFMLVVQKANKVSIVHGGIKIIPSIKPSKSSH